MTSKNPTYPELLVPVTPEEREELAEIRQRFIHVIFEIMQQNEFDLIQVYPETENLEELYTQLVDLKKCLDSFRPFNVAQMQRLREVWDTEYTYESNAIEGNSLTLQETSMVINEGITIGSKPMKDHLEAINHAEAVKRLHQVAQKKHPLNERILLEFHNLILHGIQSDDAGRYRNVGVRVRGSARVFPNFLKVPDLMVEYFSFYDANKDQMHPVAMAAHLHQKLVNIHPFIDGNGRASRLIMNMHLLQSGYPITILSAENEKRHAYYAALEAYNDGENSEAFERFIAQNVKRWCFEYLKMIACGGGEEEERKGYYYYKKIEPFL